MTSRFVRYPQRSSRRGRPLRSASIRSHEKGSGVFGVHDNALEKVFSAKDSRPPISRRRAFTLLELLIAMTLTLMLVYAIAQFYAFVGETVRDGRAQIEMGGQLRAASAKLRQDFAELTVRVGGRIDAGQQMGCFEIVEGIASDADPEGDLVINAQWVDANSDGVPDNDVNGDLKPDGTMLGDCDDILVMTIRSQGEPYVGRHCYVVPGSGPPQYAYETVRSNLAEVIWFTTFNDMNGNGTWQINEPRYLVRRQLLILPGTTLVWPPGATAPFQPGESIYHHNDISCHAVLNSMGNFAGYVANTLGDLSQRENRMVHQNLTNLNLNGLFAAQGNMPNPLQLNVGLTDVPSTPLYQAGSYSLYSLDGIGRFQGEDKLLSNVLAFDVRVYDPYALLRADNSDMTGSTATTTDDAQGVLAPGDPGYAFAVANGFPYFATNASIGQGAYVDLWYNRSFGTNTALYQNSAYSWAPNSTLSPPPDPQWSPPPPLDPQWPNVTVNNRAGVATGPAIWDTWTTAYEKDGINQVFDGNDAAVLFNFASRDWLVDGLDNGTMAYPASGGVDDPSEADTRSPYPSWVGDNGVDDDGQNGIDDAVEQSYPRPPVLASGLGANIPTTLRGIEARIRMYEPGTRQTRQATVTTDFIPE